ncbi:hypothetical protein AWB78_03305 [Caballeronia calidae]|uniref:Uncharacterized protein n=1 Tax=Caballeronia calidae TaxID=1777139 RepID=A0A158C065_9BURK|nr:hypothetical protein AWB78_03305 [Caballeronia calidae]
MKFPRCASTRNRRPATLRKRLAQIGSHRAGFSCVNDHLCNNVELQRGCLVIDTEDPHHGKTTQCSEHNRREVLGLGMRLGDFREDGPTKGVELSAPEASEDPPVAKSCADNLKVL